MERPRNGPPYRARRYSAGGALTAAGPSGKPCGIEANSAKYLAAEAGFHACEAAIMTHGGMGYVRKLNSLGVKTWVLPGLSPKVNFADFRVRCGAEGRKRPR